MSTYFSLFQFSVVFAPQEVQMLRYESDFVPRHEVASHPNKEVQDAGQRYEHHPKPEEHVDLLVVHVDG